MRRILPLLALIATILTAVIFLPDIGWETLSRDQDWLLGWVAAHPVAAPVSFFLLYVLTTALSLPHGALQTVAGGLLFGTVFGCTLTVLGATIGASILLIVVRNTFAAATARHRDRIPESVRVGLARDEFSYLLAIRLLPVFPFWLVNLAAAVAGLRLLVFVPATLLGISPVSFILSSIGARVGEVLRRGERPDLSIIFTPHILLPLLALAGMSLLPALLRRRRDVHA